ncbi:MAG: PEGA domain-containing protein, partial [Methanospirillum sp.]|nr:PEGA domain-containing protein [Methanospirillum sp.]
QGTDTVDVPMTLDSATDAGLSGYRMTITIANGDIAKISAINFPSWASLSKIVDTLPGSIVTFSALDLKEAVTSGAKNVELATITFQKAGEGTTGYTVNITALEDDNGNQMTGIATTLTGTITTVGSSSGNSSDTTPVPTEEPVTQVTTPVPTESPEKIITPVVTPTPVPTVDADFLSNVRNGSAPMTVSFTDNSSGYPDSFFWNFGDGSSDNTSVIQNPQHTYRIPGIFPVSLSVANSKYNDTVTKEGYISIIGVPSADSRTGNSSTTVFSVPDNAEVYLNNVYYGLTPVVIENLTPRNYQLRLHKEGYYDTVETIVTRNGVLPTFISGFEMIPHYAEIGELSADPAQTGAAYIISYPEMVNVSIDGKTVGKTDIMVMNLPVGVHNLTLNKPGFQAWNDTFEVKNGLGVIQTYHFEEPYFPLNRSVEYV